MGCRGGQHSPGSLASLHSKDLGDTRRPPHPSPRSIPMPPSPTARGPASKVLEWRLRQCCCALQALWAARGTICSRAQRQQSWTWGQEGPLRWGAEQRLWDPCSPRLCGAQHTVCRTDRNHRLINWLITPANYIEQIGKINIWCRSLFRDCMDQFSTDKTEKFP